MKLLSDYIGAIPLGSDGAAVVAVDLTSDGKRIAGLATEKGYIKYSDITDGDLLELSPDAEIAPLTPVVSAIDTLLVNDKGGAIGRIKDACVKNGSVTSYLIEKPYNTSGAAFEIGETVTVCHRKKHPSSSEKESAQSLSPASSLTAVAAKDGCAAVESAAQSERAIVAAVAGTAPDDDLIADAARTSTHADDPSAPPATRRGFIFSRKNPGDRELASAPEIDPVSDFDDRVKRSTDAAPSDFRRAPDVFINPGQTENAKDEKPSEEPDTIDFLPERIIADYSFLLGRIVTDDIESDGRIIIHRGELILARTVAAARRHFKLLDLTVKSKS